MDNSTFYHMINKEELHARVENSFKYMIRIGYDNALTMEGMRTMVVNTKKGNKKVNSIYYTPNLKYNFLSVENIMERNYNLILKMESV